MTTLADKAIFSGADNRPPMMEKDMYESWKSIMELYLMNREHGRKYLELTPSKAIQADYDVKTTNIILQGLPPEVYALVSNHKVAKQLWERIQLLMQGTCKPSADPVSISSLSKFTPTLSSITSIHSSIWNTPYMSQQYIPNSSSTPPSLTYPSNDFQSLVNYNMYSPQPAISQMDYPPVVNPQQQSEFSQFKSGLFILVFKQGDDPIDAINHMMSFLSVVVTSRFPTINNQLRNSSNPHQQAIIHDGRVTVQLV
nr:hypothetical protein [Tanacetum cinerariifolium]